MMTIDSGAMYVRSPPTSVVADLIVVKDFRLSIPPYNADALVGLLMIPPPPVGLSLVRLVEQVEII